MQLDVKLESLLEKAKDRELARKWKSARLLYERALKINSRFAEAYAGLGRVSLWNQDPKAALRNFSTAFELKRVSAGDPPIMQPITVAKIRHAIQQLQFLLEKKLIEAKYKDQVKFYRKLLVRFEKDRERDVWMLNWKELSLLEPAHSFALHCYRPDRIKGTAINQKMKITELKWRGSSGGPPVFLLDNVLTSTSLKEIQRFCRESMIWHTPNSGYVTSALDEGFHCGLLFQIGEELREFLTPLGIKVPPLTTLWSMNYDPHCDGAPPHCDPGQLNVNLWITPDKANLDPSTGGLTIYSVEPPKNWTPIEFQVNPRARMEKYLRSVKHDKITVPYRMNRALAFSSKIIHKTNKVRFVEGLNTRRINVTFVFGDWKLDSALLPPRPQVSVVRKK